MGGMRSRQLIELFVGLFVFPVGFGLAGAVFNAGISLLGSALGGEQEHSAAWYGCSGFALAATFGAIVGFNLLQQWRRDPNALPNS